MKPLEDLLPRVMPKVEGCAEPTALEALRVAAIEFCERTRLWRGSDTFYVRPDDWDVVCAPDGAVIHEIESARLNDRPLEPTSLSHLDRVHPRWREEEGDLGRYITQVLPDTVRTVPLVEGRLDLSLWLKPASDTDFLPNFLVKQHAVTLAEGALAELRLMPQQPFTNADLAVYHSQRFRADLDRLASASMRGQQRAPVRTVAGFF